MWSRFYNYYCSSHYSSLWFQACKYVLLDEMLGSKKRERAVETNARLIRFCTGVYFITKKVLMITQYFWVVIRIRSGRLSQCSAFHPELQGLYGAMPSTYFSRSMRFIWGASSNLQPSARYCRAGNQQRYNMQKIVHVWILAPENNKNHRSC